MNVEGGLQLGDLWGTVRRRGKVAAFTALGIFLASYWLAMALPNVYTSYATVLVEPQSVDEELVRAGVAASDLNERLHLMTAQILSRPRLSRIIDELELYSDESEYMLREEVIDLMRSRVRVAPVVSEMQTGGSRRVEQDINEFQIFFDDYDATVARDVAQRLANDFIQTHIEDRVKVSQKSLEFIESELQRLADRIRTVEADIAKVKNENPGKLPEDMTTNQRRLERLQGELASVQRTLSDAQSDEAFYRSQLATFSHYNAPNDDASPARRLELLKLQLAEYKSKGYTEKHPDIVKTRAEIAEVEAGIRSSEGDPESQSTSLVAQQIGAEVRRAELRRAAAEQEVERITKLAAGIQALLAETPAVAEQLDVLRREYEHLFESFQDFSNRRLEATVQAQLERRQLGEQFRVLESAFIAPEPSAPNRLLIVVLGAIFGVAVGIGTALLLEATDTSSHDARQLQTRIALPVLAAIPEILLESDRVRMRRKRVRMAMATTGLVGFVLLGGAANYLWVNGAPRFLEGPMGEEKPAADVARPQAEG
jgi:succinoglycan biosynthesis transport protein ExoP